uniref:V-set and immunoglobulin domain-containing protein 8-like n=1 Tax=Podarcis muralis TaxID=64176 RepID=UPI0010A01D41|nr:V-set and immunoglobulin domain-containing protein 8-like [Podarcis muralis]
MLCHRAMSAQAQEEVSCFAVRIKEKGQDVIYLPKGESVKLGCPFASDPEDDTPDNGWDIEWKQVKPGPHPQDYPLLSYHDNRVIYPGPPDLQQRVGFISPDPSLYDASMQLRDVQITDSATYECKVKKTTEASHKVTITVQERPLLPQCSIIGEIAYGADVTLRCFTSTGSPPLTYQWSMTHGHQFRDWMPPGGSMGSVPGDLHIRDLCEDHVGTYQCSVRNNVGVAYCSVDIYFGGGYQRGLIIVGSVIIPLLALALIIGGSSGAVHAAAGKAGVAVAQVATAGRIIAGTAAVPAALRSRSRNTRRPKPARSVWMPMLLQADRAARRSVAQAASIPCLAATRHGLASTHSAASTPPPSFR